MSRLERWLDRMRSAWTGQTGWSTDEAPLVRALAAAALADDGADSAAVARVERVALEAFRRRVAEVAIEATDAAPGRPAVPAPGGRAVPLPVRPAMPAPGRSPASDGRPTSLRGALPRRLAGLGAAMAALVLAAASAVAGPTSPLYDVRVSWEEMTLPSDPDLRLAGEAERLDRRLAEAQAALTAGVPAGAHTALAAYASICGSISPAGADARAVAAFAVALHAEVQALEMMRNRQDQVSAWVDDALRAAGGLEQRLRDGLGPPSIAGPPASPDGFDASPAPAGGTGAGGGQPSSQASPAASGTRTPVVPGTSGGSGESGGPGESGASGAAGAPGESGPAPSGRPTQRPLGPNPSGSGAPASGSPGPGDPGTGQPGSTPRPGGSGPGAGVGGSTSLGVGAGAVPTPPPSAAPDPGSAPDQAGASDLGGGSTGGA